MFECERWYVVRFWNCFIFYAVVLISWYCLCGLVTNCDVVVVECVRDFLWVCYYFPSYVIVVGDVLAAPLDGRSVLRILACCFGSFRFSSNLICDECSFCLLDGFVEFVPVFCMFLDVSWWWVVYLYVV